MKKNRQRAKIIFMGTPRFGAIILQKMAENNYFPELVITGSDKKRGRGQSLAPCPVKLIAKQYGLLCKESDKIIELKTTFEKIKPDLVLSAAFGQIIPKEILNISLGKFLNIHPSLLPKFRGPSPVQFTILNNEAEAGTSIIEMTDRLDAGPIVMQESISLANKKLTYQELHELLAELSGNLLIKILPQWFQGKIKPVPQDNSKATYTRLLTKQDGKINWSKTAQFLERQIRAFYPWPGSYAFWPTKNKLISLKILKAEALDQKNQSGLKLGRVILLDNNLPAVQCSEGMLIIKRLQMQNKKEMDSQDLIRGYRNFIGSILK